MRPRGSTGGGNREIADAEPEGHGLGEELGIECEVVRVLLEGNRLEDAPRVHAEAGVKVPEVLAKGHNLDRRQDGLRGTSTGGIPPASASRRLRMREPRTTSQMSRSMEPDEQRDEPGVVLAVGVDHCDNVARALACRTIARLLIRTVAAIAPVLDDREPKPSRDLDRPIAARILDPR